MRVCRGGGPYRRRECWWWMPCSGNVSSDQARMCSSACVERRRPGCVSNGLVQRREIHVAVCEQSVESEESQSDVQMVFGRVVKRVYRKRGVAPHFYSPVSPPAFKFQLLITLYCTQLPHQFTVKRVVLGHKLNFPTHNRRPSIASINRIISRHCGYLRHFPSSALEAMTVLHPKDCTEMSQKCEIGWASWFRMFTQGCWCFDRDESRRTIEDFTDGEIR
jgi:hypothetical protein